MQLSKESLLKTMKDKYGLTSVTAIGGMGPLSLGEYRGKTKTYRKKGGEDLVRESLETLNATEALEVINREVKQIMSSQRAEAGAVAAHVASSSNTSASPNSVHVNKSSLAAVQGDNTASKEGTDSDNRVVESSSSGVPTGPSATATVTKRRLPASFTTPRR